MVTTEHLFLPSLYLTFSLYCYSLTTNAPNSITELYKWDHFRRGGDIKHRGHKHLVPCTDPDHRAPCSLDPEEAEVIGEQHQGAVGNNEAIVVLCCQHAFLMGLDTLDFGSGPCLCSPCPSRISAGQITSLQAISKPQAIYLMHLLYKISTLSCHLFLCIVPLK